VGRQKNKGIVSAATMRAKNTMGAIGVNIDTATRPVAVAAAICAEMAKAAVITTTATDKAAAMHLSMKPKFISCSGSSFNST